MNPRLEPALKRLGAVESSITTLREDMEKKIADLSHRVNAADMRLGAIERLEYVAEPVRAVLTGCQRRGPRTTGLKLRAALNRLESIEISLAQLNAKDHTTRRTVIKRLVAQHRACGKGGK